MFVCITILRRAPTKVCVFRGSSISLTKLQEKFLQTTTTVLESFLIHGLRFNETMQTNHTKEEEEEEEYAHTSITTTKYGSIS